MRIVEKFVQWGVTVDLEFIKSQNLKKLIPFTTSKGMIFNEKNELLIIKEGKSGNWNLPGGTIEANEDPLNALIREVDEEADVDLKDIKLVGAKKHVFKKKPENIIRLRKDGRLPQKGLIAFHLIYFARIKKVKPQSIDPYHNKILERKFIDINDFFITCLGVMLVGKWLKLF